MKKEDMNIVIVGHVDHGKSTLMGRLLADTNSLPEGKLEQVKQTCRRNSKPFEYAFLLDALKDEQSQGITIDTARCFFKTDKRDYIILDVRRADEFADGHIPGAINVANEDIQDVEPAELPDKNQTIYVYCRSGNRSKQAASKLAAMGYTNIIEFGGILDWTGEIER